MQLRRLYSVKPKPKSRNGNADNTVGRPVCECVCVCVCGKGSEMWGEDRGGRALWQKEKPSFLTDRTSGSLDPPSSLPLYYTDSLSVAMSETLTKKWQHERQQQQRQQSP